MELNTDGTLPGKIQFSEYGIRIKKLALECVTRTIIS